MIGSIELTDESNCLVCKSSIDATCLLLYSRVDGEWFKLRMDEPRIVSDDDSCIPSFGATLHKKVNFLAVFLPYLLKYWNERNQNKSILVASRYLW